MTEVRYKEVATYYNICKTCGKEFIVPDKGFSQKICYPCQEKAAVAKAKKKLLPFVGAKVTCIEPVHDGIYTSDDQLEFIEITLADGRRVVFSVAGPYIQWEIRSTS